MIKNINIDLLYQPLLQKPPMTPDQLQQQAVSADKTTINHWEKTWMKNIRACKEHFGSFAQYSIGKLHGLNRYRPAIVIGSGPSLGETLKALKENQELDYPLLTISCLHNYGYFKDHGIKIDYYLTLDAGDIVKGDVAEGQSKTLEEYMLMSHDDKLLAFIGTDPELFKMWKGQVFLFNSMVPDMRIRKEFDEVEVFRHFISSGGNALGACMYAAKAIMGSSTIIYTGADFCFSYDNKFHSYSTHYDDLGNYVLWSDVFGVVRKTWSSYLNFKFWFDKISMTVPGTWINSSFGLLGAYQGGNLSSFQYMPLEAVLQQYRMTSEVSVTDTKVGDYGQLVVDKVTKLKLADLYADPTYEKHISLF